MRKLAERLVLHETRESPSSQTDAAAAFRLFDALRPSLANLMGVTGFQALLSRALALANAEAPWLRALHVAPEGALQGVAELEAQLQIEEIVEGGVVLLAQLLGLLVAFIGEDLTLRLVREVWPKLPLAETAVGKRR